MSVLEMCVHLTAEWRAAVAQARTARRAQRHALAALCTLGRRTLSRCLTSTRQHLRDWSSDDVLYARRRWDAARLFRPAQRYSAAHSYLGHIAVAFDDTRWKKTGRKIPGAQYHRDPLSPPFHVNLLFGLRRLQTSALVPLHRLMNAAAFCPSAAGARGL